MMNIHRAVRAGLSAVALLALSFVAFGQAEEQEHRIWTDIKGRKITALLLAIEGEAIQLKKDGNVYTLPTARLSEADRSYLQSVMNGSDAESAEESPGTDPASVLLAECLSHARVTAVQTIPPIDLLNPETGKLDQERLVRVMELLPEPGAVRDRWAPNPVWTVRACAVQLLDAAPGVKYLGLTFAPGDGLEDPASRAGEPDHVIPAEHEPALEGFALVELPLEWQLWGWIALGVDEDGMVRALRLDCRALLKAKAGWMNAEH